MVQPDSLSGRAGSRADAAARLGALEGAFSAFTEFRYNDNVRLEAGPGISAGSVQLGGKVRLHYPISAVNDLTLEASAAQEFFFRPIEGRQTYRTIEPGSALGLDVIVGRAKIHPFVTAQLQEDPITSPVLNDTDRFGRLNLDAGVQVDWDLNRAVLQGSAIVGRQEELDGGNGYLNAWRRAVSLRPVFPLGPGQLWGLSFSGSQNDYDRTRQNDSTTLSAGGLLSLSLGKNRRMQLSAGLSRTDYETRGSIADYDDRRGLYGQFQFDHQVRRAMRYTVLLRHDGYEGFGTNFYQITSLSLTPQLNVFRRGELSTGIAYEWIDESGTRGEQAERIGLNCALKVPIGRKFDATLSWQYFSKHSDRIGRDYTRQLWAIRLNYTP